MLHPDLEQLLNTILPFAQQMLIKHGEFFPFGASITTDGKVSLNAGDTGDERPQAQQIIDLLTGAYRKQTEAGQLRAAAMCYDGLVVPPGQTEKRDAICICLEHQSGEAYNAFVPYRKGWFGRIRYDELFAARRKPEFFAQAEPT